VSNSRAESRAGDVQQESMSLFDRIMDDAAKQAYDPQIGQYVHKRRAHRALQQAEHESRAASEVTGETELTASTSAITFHGLETEFDYVKRMKNERHAMTYNVARRNKIAREKRLKGEGFSDANGSAISVPRHTYKPCTLCQQDFPPKSLKGLVPLNAVVKWRNDHGAPVNAEDPRWKQRLDPSKRYEPCKLCIFCMQFFDKNFVEYISYHKGTTQLKDRALDMEGERSDSGLDENVSRVLEKKKPGALIPFNTEHIEPVLQDLAFLHLKTMSEKPRLMETMGCQLARYSNPANRIKLKTQSYGGARRRSGVVRTLKKKGGASESHNSAERSAYAPSSSTAFPKQKKKVKIPGETSTLSDGRASRLVTHKRKERADRFVDQIMTQSADFGGSGKGGMLRFPPISQKNNLLERGVNIERQATDGDINSSNFVGERSGGEHTQGDGYGHHEKQRASFSEEIKLAVSDGVWKKSKRRSRKVREMNTGGTTRTSAPQRGAQQERTLAL